MSTAIGQQCVVAVHMCWQPAWQPFASALTAQLSVAVLKLQHMAALLTVLLGTG